MEMGRDFHDTCYSPNNLTELKTNKHNFMIKIILSRDYDKFSSMRMLLVVISKPSLSTQVIIKLETE